MRADDEVSETDGEDRVSHRSYSQVEGEGEYAPGDIHLFLKYTFRQRKVKVEAFFPDPTAFLIAVQQICRNRDRFEFNFHVHAQGEEENDFCSEVIPRSYCHQHHTTTYIMASQLLR